jgi:chromosome partitioning protein
MRKIAIAMAKGGVGKTTTAVNLAHGLANHGYRVLLVDCDTQGQVSKFLGVNPDYGLYEFITERGKNGEHISKNNAIYPSRQNLWLLAGGVRLVELKNWLGEQPCGVRQTILRKELVPKQGTLDYLIFDCAPGWDVLSVLSGCASSSIVGRVENLFSIFAVRSKAECGSEAQIHITHNVRPANATEL